MSECVEIELPYPPSVNTYWRHTRSGKHYISEKGRAFKKKASELCNQFDPFDGSVEIKIEVYPPDNRSRDLDNILKGLFDSLVSSGIIKDDSNKIIKKFSVEAKQVIRKGKTIVHIRKL